MINPMELTRRRILVTGASSGIGRQTAITLSQLGANVVLVARRKEKLEETLSLLEGERHKYYSFDLTKIDEIEDFIKCMVSEDGAFDGVAYCAGISTNRPLNMYTYDKLHALMLINFYAFFELVRVISHKKNFNKGMHIVAVSSTASVKGNSAQTAYAASKAALDSAVRCMAKELHGKGIYVNSVLPSMIKTEMYQQYASRSGSIGSYDLVMAERQYLGVGEPVDIANSIAFLLSPASRFITGTQLAVDGGYTSC